MSLVRELITAGLVAVGLIGFLRIVVGLFDLDRYRRSDEIWIYRRYDGQ